MILKQKTFHSDCASVQGGRRRWRQSGRRQQPTGHHLHRLQDVPEHCRQRQGRKHTHAHTYTELLLTCYMSKERKEVEGSWSRLALWLWRADDPQLSQPYRVSHAVTMGRSRGCVCVPVAERLCSLCRSMCVFYYMQTSIVRSPTPCRWRLCVCWCVRRIQRCHRLNGEAVGDEKPLQVVCVRL